MSSSARGATSDALAAVVGRRLLDRARRALGVKTDAEAIRVALAAVVTRDRQIRGLRTFVALGPLDASRID